ncbi:MAG: glycosyltransferase family 2 protein [Candidatus Sumerlaeia bacterium]|nr:glycosyltransferase family 2 protein [Candidatus Sumerlaeia bacterium]
MKVSIIIPIYNERDLLERVLEKVRAVELDKELILVDDCSKDGTREYLREHEVGRPGTTVLFHKRNRGKGRAIRTGLTAATGDIVIIQDADLEYEPSEIPSIVRPIMDGRTEVCYGSRFLGRSPTGMRLPNYVANRLLALSVALLYWQVITDEATAYKAFRTSVLKSIPLRCERFEFCPEVTSKVLMRGIRIHEVPVTFFARTFAEGKKIGWRDFIEAVSTLVRCRLGLM